MCRHGEFHEKCCASYAGEGIAVIEEVERDEEIHATLAKAAETIASAMKAASKLLAAYNGGIAADAQHLVAEFVSHMTGDRAAMRAIALTTDTLILAAVGNDCGFESVLMRRIEALGQRGDQFLGISKSGNSANVLHSLRPVT